MGASRCGRLWRMSTPRTRLTADARTEQIVARAEELIRKTGFQALSIAAVADACGLTRAGVLHHVGSKDQLLIAILEAKERETAVEIDELVGRTGRRDAKEVLNVLMRRNIDRPEILHLFTVLAAESINLAHPAHSYFAERIHRGARALSPLFVDFSDAPDEVALEVLSYMDGLQLNWLRDRSIDIWGRWSDFLRRYFVALEGDVRPETGS